MDVYSREKKINADLLREMNEAGASVLSHFGHWVHEVDQLSETFLNAKPFEHIVIDQFLEPKYAEQLHDAFPKCYDHWYKYENPIELKYSFDDIVALEECMYKYFHFLATDSFLQVIRRLTRMGDISYDEYLHGAGLHCHPTGGKLNIHLDYEKHPITGMERKINIILFLTKGWDPAWGGQNELWDHSAENCMVKTNIVFNRAILFKTNDISFHGLPTPIQCPPDFYRKTMAFYYVAPLSSTKREEEYRKKAKYVLTHKDEIHDPLLKRLCEIRANRRITKEDFASKT